jgi:ATP-dependent DNA helicase RecQ
MSTEPVFEALDERVALEVKRYWGYESLRPIQAEAIRAGLDKRDSLVVMPTGGGKSLCYQVPPLVSGKMSVVVSPLISLMKDQVDGLTSIGYPAAGLHSGIGPEERREIEAGVAQGKFKLIFVAPERLMTAWFLQLLEKAGVNSFAIDEAHCISQWGHDFRPEYRQLSMLKERFPGASIHAYTATATPRVREDIVAQLGLVDPTVLVGVFDRPNLTYRVLPTQDLQAQVVEAVKRHEGEASIVYCLSRKDTETLAAMLKANGVKAGYYHAGMPPTLRQKTQEEFSDEELDVVVATVAFGMGIDRSNVRCVIHAAMPKTVEGYQQETGRAGRDGLEAECVLFYTPADVMRWESLITKSSEGAPDPEAQIATQLELLNHMQRFCNSARCRHRALSEYFGQEYPAPRCEACDVCLNEVEGVEGATVIAQKIMSAVARTGQRFGVGHVVDVLMGANTEMVRKCRHEELSVYGLLKSMPKTVIQAYVYQLIDQGLLSRTPGDRPTLALNDASLAVMRGKQEVFLIRPRESAAKARTRTAEDSWEGVDRGLFESLRELRKRVAQERGVPPFVVFTDVTLREMARLRPSTLEGMRRVKGIGERKLADLGERFQEAVTEYCISKQVGMDVGGAAGGRVMEIQRVARPNAVKETARRMFGEGATLEEVVQATGRARSTVSEYLAQFITETRPVSVDVWVAPEVYARIADVAGTLEEVKLKPIYEKLGGTVSWEEIRVTLTHMGTV